MLKYIYAHFKKERSSNLPKDISDRIQKASSRLRESLTKEEGRIGLNLRNILPKSSIKTAHKNRYPGVCFSFSPQIPAKRDSTQYLNHQEIIGKVEGKSSLEVLKETRFPISKLISPEIKPWTGIFLTYLTVSGCS